MIYPYWRLYARIFNIKICRKCGNRLDPKYKKRRRGRLCLDCFIKDLLDIDTLK